MIGSYHNGFAPRDGEPRYPQLWRGLVGAWCPSLGPTGATLRDWSGRCLHGTLTSMTLNSAWVRSAHKGGGTGALLFGGAPEYVNVPFHSALNFTGTAVTQTAWVKTSSTAAVIGSNFANLLGTEGYGFGVGLGGTTSGAFSVQISSAAGGNFRTSGVVINDNAWHFVAYTLQGSSGTMYVDGAQVSTFPHSDGVITAGTLPFRIARSADFDGVYLSGHLDDLAVWNRALTFAEIARLYDGGNGRGKLFEMRQRPRTRSAAGGMLLQRRRICA